MWVARRSHHRPHPPARARRSRHPQQLPDALCVLQRLQGGVICGLPAWVDGPDEPTTRARQTHPARAVPSEGRHTDLRVLGVDRGQAQSGQRRRQPQRQDHHGGQGRLDHLQGRNADRAALQHLWRPLLRQPGPPGVRTSTGPLTLDHAPPQPGQPPRLGTRNIRTAGVREGPVSRLFLCQRAGERSEQRPDKVATEGSHAVSEYRHVGKFGKTAQGRPVRAKRSGRCHLCSKGYPVGEKLIYLPGSDHAVHPDCAYSTVEIRRVV